jgi:nitrogen-specific signal transduction histidine kinase
VTTKVTRYGDRSVVVEVVRDVSERERAAAERAELEQRLVRAGRLEALGRLAAGIAHDFNNLLCVISMGGELAAELADEDPEAARHELATIATAVESATRLTRQLLAFSGRQLSRTLVVDVNARIEALARMLERTLGSRIKLALDLDVIPLLIAIDPAHFEQVITNLVINARDAMADGGTITITTRAANAGASIEITDTGTGIPDHVLANIFEPFFTTKGPEKGTGLGLATVHEVVRRSRGTIDVRSQLGAGTTFTLWFPQTDGVVHQTTQIATLVPAGRGENVLVVEDDSRLRDITRRVLAGGGYAVHEVCDGEEALAYVQSGSRVDVVVADIELPGMSGVEWRGDQAHVATSTFLPKPYSPDELMRSLRKVLDAKP